MFRHFDIVRLFTLLIVSLPLLVAFQNCDTQSKKSPPGRTPSTSAVGGGNGNSYDGKLSISAPAQMSPGESVKIFVEGGVPPYEVSSTSSDVLIVFQSPGTYELTLSESSSETSIEVLVADSTNETASTLIQIWGINNWFFEDPLGLHAFGGNQIAVVEQGLPGITFMDFDGKIDLQITNSLIPGVNLYLPREVQVVNNSQLVVSNQLRDGSWELLKIDYLNLVILERVQDLNRASFNGCGGIKSLKLSQDLKLYLACDQHVFVFDSSNLAATPQTLGLNSISEPIGSIDIFSSGKIIVGHQSMIFQIFDPEDQSVTTVPMAEASSEFYDGIEPLSITTVNEEYVFVVGKDYTGWTFNVSNGEIHTIINTSPYYYGRPGFSTMSPFGELLITFPEIQGVFKMDPMDLYGVEGMYSSQSLDLRAFYFPTEIYVTDQNNVYLIDSLNFRLNKYNTSGFVQSIFPQSDQGGWLKSVSEIAAGNNGKVYSVNVADPFVRVLSEDSGELSQLGSDSLSLLQSPVGVAITENDILLVADIGTYKVLAFNTEGDFLYEFGIPDEHSFHAPVSLLVHKSSVYILFGNTDIVEFDLNGNYLRTVFTRSNETGPDWGTAENFTYNPVTNQFLLTDSQKNDIKVISAQGEYQGKFGKTGSGPGEFMNPVGLDVDTMGYVYIVDKLNSRIQIFPPDILEKPSP